MAALPAVCHGSRLHFPTRAAALGGSSPLPCSTWTQLGRCTLLASAVAIRCRGRTVARTAAKTTAASVKPKGESAETALTTTQAEVSKKLDMFESVRSVCQSVDIPLPGVVVVGEQSAGKSSLLENISGIQFPRAQNTCTRMPCVLSLLTDPTVKESHAMVSMEPGFANATTCTVPEVEKQIKQLTEEHAPGGDEFISSKAMYIRVVRKEGPQLSLIDLPGVTHNSDEMKDIHEVTVNLVGEYIRPEEMVILCVIPAMSDFGNAEVVKLARKYDPDGIRTLGVVTKCDDAANAEASDIVEKVLMSRNSDVGLELGFHCVVNRSQKNIDEQMSREALWAKEKEIFTKSDRMKGLPEKNWGTLRLMEKIAQIQEARVDECLPEIKESVRKKMEKLQEELHDLPLQPETEADRSRLLNRIISEIRDDLARRIRAEFMSAERSDRDLTIAPIVASMVQDFKRDLLKQNPNWLGEAMIEEVDDTVQNYVAGFTVDNLIGPQVFNNLIKQTFIDEGLLKRSVHGLVSDVGEHLRNVVMHVIEAHANNYPILSTRLDAKAEDCIDQLTVKTRGLCEMLAEAEQVTSTTYGQYTVKLTEFKSWLHDLKGGGTDKLATALRGVEGQASEVPEEFLSLVKEAQEEPRKLGTLEICASLHVYTGLMIEGFVESSAKLVKFFMMLQLLDELEAIWRGDLGALGELFPMDQTLALKKEDLARKIDELSGFKEKLMSLRPAALPAKRRKRTLSANAQTRASAKVEQVAPEAFFIWNFTKELQGKTFKTGDEIKSHKFSQLGVPDLHLSLFPKGNGRYNRTSLCLHAPSGWQIKYKAQAIRSPDVELQELTCEMRQEWLHEFTSLSPASTTSWSVVAVKLLQVIAPNSKI